MDSLPAELLELVLDQCEHSSLKSLRLVNRSFQYATTARVFEHFDFAIFDNSLDKLTALAKSPLGQHVKRFTLFADILPIYGERGSWENTIYLWRNQSDISAQTYFSLFGFGLADVGNSSDLDHHLEADLASAWNKYETMLRTQGSWRRDVQGLAFKEMFAMLPNVLEATASVASPQYPDTDNESIWKRLRTRVLLGRENWFYHGNIRLDWKKTRARLSNQATSCLVEAVGFRATFSGTLHLTKLTVHSPDTTVADGCFLGSLINQPVRICYPEQQNTARSLREGFRPLTELDLRFQCVSLDSGGSECPDTELTGLLNAAQSLRSLKLHCKKGSNSKKDPWQYTASRQIFQPLLRNPQLWPCLEKLNLTIDINSTLFLSLLQKLSTSLKSLELRDMKILGTSSLLSQIPRIVNLDHVYIESLWYGLYNNAELISILPQGAGVQETYEMAMKAYLLRKRAEMPKRRGFEEFKAEVAESSAEAVLDVDDLGPTVSE